MKIAMIGHKRIPSREGGVEIVVEELSVRFAALGHKVVAYNRKGHHVSGSEFDKTSRKEYKGVKLKTVFTLQAKAFNALIYSFLAAVRASFSRFDVVHIHAEGPAVMTLIPKLFGKRVIVTIHGLDWKRSKWGGFSTKYLKLGEKIAAKHADEVIVLSKNVQEYFRTEYNRETLFIPNGITKPEIKPVNIIKDSFGLDENGYILYLGRLVPEKCVHLLIEAYKTLNTDKKLVIAGGSSHTDEYAQNLRTLADGDGRIIFTGFVEGETLEELYSNAYIYCLPSNLEGMPLSLLEALSYGNCCLISDIAECTEVCGDKAEVFKCDDTDDLREKLRGLLADESKVNAMKAEASDYVCAKYNWDNIAEQTLRAYEKN